MIVRSVQPKRTLKLTRAFAISNFCFREWYLVVNPLLHTGHIWAMKGL